MTDPVAPNSLSQQKWIHSMKGGKMSEFVPDPVAEMKARAQQWRETNVYKLREGIKTWPLTADEFDDYLAAFSAKEVERATEAERLENAKAVCGACKEPENYELPKYGIEFGWTWSHQHKNSPVMMKCAAAPIWERAHGKGENKNA